MYAAVKATESGKGTSAMNQLSGYFDRRLLAMLFATAVGLSIFLFHLPFAKDSYLVDDSADYLRAANTDFAAIYLNTNSASPVALHRLLKDPAFEAAPWDYLYFRGDNAALRHFHSPFSYYTMHVVSSMHGSDRDQRLLVSAVTASTCFAITMGLILLDVPAALAASLALLAGVQTSYTEVSVDPTPHSWYMLFAVLFLLLFSRYLVGHRFRTLALSAIALGFAFATLEFSLELILSVPLTIGYLWIFYRWPKSEIRALLKQIARAAPVFLGTTFVLWPGGWLRGGYLESYGVTGATVFFKNKHAFGSKLTAGVIYQKLFDNRVDILAIFLFFVLALAFLSIKRKLSIGSIVFSSYAIIAFGLGVADHFRLGTYVSEFLLFLIVAAGFLCRDVLEHTWGAWRRPAIAAACILLLLGSALEWSHRRNSMFYRPWLQPLMQTISAEIPKGETILVNDNWESLYAYLPGYDYEPTTAKNSNVPRTPARAADARFFLLENTTPPPPHTQLLHSYMTYPRGHSLNLYISK